MHRDQTLRIPLRIVFYKEDGDWVAHCLEFNLIGDGRTRDKAIECLNQAILVQVTASLESQNLDNLFSPADNEYFLRYAKGKDIADRMLEIPKHQLQRDAPIIDGIDYREYEDSESALQLA